MQRLRKVSAIKLALIAEPQPILCKDMFLLPNLSPKQRILRVLLVWQGNFCVCWKDKNRERPLALDAMSLTSHGRCGRLKIPRASSGIFRRLQHPPIGFCIQHKAINKIKPFLRDKNESLKSSVQFVAAILRTRLYSWTRIERIWRIKLCLIIH